MNGRILVFGIVIVTGALAVGSAAYQEEPATEVVRAAPSLSVNASIGPILPSVSAYGVFDPADGRLLLANNPDEQLPVASITKLISAMAVRDQFDLEQRTTLQWSDLNAVGVAGNLQYGQEYSYRELLFPLLLSSSNNAALTFERRAQQQGMSLPEVMNELVKRYGYGDMQFKDASGLSVGNQATVRDLAGIIAATRYTYSYVYHISGLTSYVGPYMGWANNSPFIEDDAYVAGKHGFTNAAGRTAVAIFREIVNGVEVEIGYIILGSTDVSRDMAQLREQTQNLAQWR